MRLWVRLTLAMAVLAVVPVVLVGLSAIEIATRRAEESSVERLRREATLHAELVDRWVHDQAPLVLGFPQLYAGRFGELSSEAQQKFPRMVYRLMPSAVTVVLVDGTGAAVVDPTYSTEPGGERTPSSPARARELIERLPLAAVLAEPSVVHTGAAWLPAGTGSRPSLPVAVLAAGGPTPADQRILGVEVALEITDHLASASSDRHAVALLDAAGSALVGGGPLVEPDRLRALLGTDQRIDFRLDADTAAGEIRGSVAPVGATGWSVVVAEPASVVLAPAVEIRRRMLPQLALAIGSAIVLALLVASSLSRPVELLRDATLELAAGRLGVHAHVRRSDEIGDLARAFDHMSDRLETSRRELATSKASTIEAFNRELQGRVDARTRELSDAQEELVRSGQLAAVAELGAGLAHELNNPLAAVLGLAQVLRSRHREGNPGEDALLDDLEAQAGRCREVVATMLRVQTLEVDPTDVPVVQLTDVLHQVRGLVGGPFRQRGVQLDVTEPDPELRVRIDPVHGSRILAQILNALRAGLEPGSAVTIDAERDGDNVLVRLIPDRPVAAHPDRRDDWLASGHGLWVARQLLARLGGRLDVDPHDTVGGPVWGVTLPGA